MKNINELINQESVFLHQWKHKIDVIGDFEELYFTAEEYFATESPYKNVSNWKENKVKVNELLNGKYKDINILFASYGYENYSGDAFVLFEQNGKLYEVNGSHCSCYGLEGQWDAEEVVLEELEHRLTEGRLGKDDYAGNTFYDELKEFLGVQ